MHHDTEALLQTTIEEIQVEFPCFRIISKRTSALSIFIHLLLKILTFGAQNRYLTEYHTVIGNTLYVPDDWAEIPCIDRVITLRHERVHLRQTRKYGFLLMAFLYLIPFFPVGLAYPRARLEWQAYTESLRATAQLKGMAFARDPWLREHIVKRFTGADYGWMWPFAKSVNRWFDTALDEIERDLDTSQTPATTEKLC